MLKRDLCGRFSLLIRAVRGSTFGAALLSMIREGDDVSVKCDNIVSEGSLGASTWLSVQIKSPHIPRHNQESHYLIFPVCINVMLCTCLMGKKKIRLLPNSIRPRKIHFLKSGNRPMRGFLFCFVCLFSIFFFFFASCYYYYEIAGDSCLEMLNETTPKKILKDFHLLSAERLSLFLKYH